MVSQQWTARPRTSQLLAALSHSMFVLAALQVFANRAMQSRAALQREAENWLEEAGTLPPGGWAAVTQSGGTAF